MKKKFLSMLLTIGILMSIIPMGTLTAHALDSRVESAITWAINIANDDTHGYSQSSRNGPNYDCSSFVSTAFKNGGFSVSGSLNTSSMANAFVNVGFTKYKKGEVTIQRGDILLKPGSHVELYLGDNKCVAAHDNYDGVSGDGNGREIQVRTKNNCTFCKQANYTYILRYNSSNNYTYSFNFNANGGSLGSSGAFSTSYGNDFQILNTTCTRSGYTWAGWNVKRNNDNKWYVAGRGWCTDSQISSNGYTKKVYSNYQTCKLDDSWINGLSGNGSYTFYAVWIQERDTRITIFTSPYGEDVDHITAKNAATSSGYAQDWIYPWYVIYDLNTGALYNTYQSKNYAVELSIYDPNGELVHSCSYTDSPDANWIGIRPQMSGTYTAKAVLTGDITANVSTSYTVSYDADLISSRNAISLNLNGTNQVTTTFTPTGGYPGNMGVSYNYDHSVIEKVSGSWSNNVFSLTVKGLKYGSTNIVMNLYENYTGNKNVVATVTVPVTVTANSYTVNYNANGGSGAPSSQTKYYGTNITLSSTVPTRSGYTFLGWASSSTATTASYQPGSTYSSNSAITLYAVWKANSTALTENTSVSATISTAGEMKYYTFTPSSTGKYVIYSTGSEDTRVYLYDSTGNMLDSDDDDGDEYNFRLEYTLNAGTTYKFGIQYYNNSITGTINFKFGKVYTITYNANGGSNAPSTQSKFFGSELTLSSSIPTRAGYTFKGWATNNSATSATYQPGDAYTSNAGATLYAVWVENPISLSVNSAVNATITSGGYVKYYTYTPTETGQYVIYSTGDTDTRVYLYDSSGNELDSDDDGGDNHNFRLVQNLTAGTTYKYAVKYYSSSTTGTINFKFGRIYNINYNANGGSGAPTTQTKDYGSDITLSSTVPIRSGYTFKGWATNSTATTASYQVEATYSTNANLTLYAVWEANTYTINYNANGGSGAPSSQTKYYGTNITLSSTVPTRSGYTFLGWASSSTATTATYQPGSTFSSNSAITLYAVWSANTYTISYNANGGSGAPSSQTKYYGTNITLSSTVPTRSGYSFLGWASSSTATTATYQPGSTYSSNSAITLYAVWTQNVVLSSISIYAMPTKTTYELGESLNTAGLVIKLHYSDSSTSTITSGFTTSGFSSTTAGTKTVTVSYGGKTTTFPVTVEEENITGAKYEVTSATGTAGSTVEVYVSIANNPGIISLRNTITYDTSALELISVEDCELLSGYTTPSTTISSPYTLRWANSLATENNLSNGRIVKLTFEIKEDAEVGNYSISVNPVEARNVDGTKITFNAATATINVVDCMIGDADGDGEISDWDAIVLNRYLAGWNVAIELAAADVDGDGEVSDWDAIVLERYLAGWNVELGI